MDRSDSISSRHRERGLTLVELMVSLAIMSILALSILGVLSYTAGRDRTSANAVATNDSARAALDLIGRDVASAGFLTGSVQAQCALTLTYDNAGSPQYLETHPIWTAPQAEGQSLPLGNTQADYPASGDNNVTQTLLLTEAPSATTFAADTAQPLYIVQFGTTQSGNGQGAISSTNLPTNTLALNNTSGIQQGDTAYLQVPMGQGNTVCIRVPIASIGSGSGQDTTYISSKPSGYMPSNGYQDFAGQIPASFGTLTDGSLLHARLLDLGHNPNTLEIIQYWIDDSNGFPVLMRGVYSALTDAPVSIDALSPGVVSLQVLLGVLPQGGTTLAWKAWQDVLATDQIEEADVALVVRTLHPDPSYVAPQSIPIPQPQPGLSGIDSFTAYVPQLDERHDHFQVYTTALFLRNLTWD